MAISNWFGIVAPKGTPKLVVARPNQAVNQALKEPDLAQCKQATLKRLHRFAAQTIDRAVFRLPEPP